MVLSASGKDSVRANNRQCQVKTDEFRMGQFYKWAEQPTIDLCLSAGDRDSVMAEMAGRWLADAGGRKTTAAPVPFTSTMYYYVL